MSEVHWRLEGLVGELETDQLIRLEELLRQAEETDEWLRAKAEEELRFPE